LLRIQEELPRAKYGQGKQVMTGLRMKKMPDELDLLRQAGQSADQALYALRDQSLLGMTEKEILRFLHETLLADGYEAVGTGIVGSGPNSASPHYRTGDRRIQRGDALVIDFGGSLKGYRSDMTRTFFVGKPSEEFTKIYQIVKDAQQLAFEAVRPGVRTEEIDRVARGYIANQGYGDNFLHRTGHGIGLDGHESPYLVEGDSTILEEGMTFSIEPGIYLDGQFGVRIEDIVSVTNRSGERLNHFPRDLQALS
jgi:Xaa-Pro aminopeptidase